MTEWSIMIALWGKAQSSRIFSCANPTQVNWTKYHWEAEVELSRLFSFKAKVSIATALQNSRKYIYEPTD